MMPRCAVLQGMLPLQAGALKRVAVLGPFADQADFILG